MPKKASLKKPVDRSAKFYGAQIPGIKEEELTGTLIIVEGQDGSGRSTQVALLMEWLESQGFAVETTGLRRSNLLAKDIDELVAKNVVTGRTLALMYATDFYDQLQNIVLPALRSGMVVLADRYIFTLIARATVRGISRNYMRNMYQMAVKPDLIFSLSVSPQEAFRREITKGQMISYWESGRDLFPAENLYGSFMKYQAKVGEEFDHLAAEYSFIQVDGAQSIPKVNLVIRQAIAKKLQIRSTKFKPSRNLMPLWR